MNTKPHYKTAGRAGGMVKVSTYKTLSTIDSVGVPTYIILGTVARTAITAITVDTVINL